MYHKEYEHSRYRWICHISMLCSRIESVSNVMWRNVCHSVPRPTKAEWSECVFVRDCQFVVTKPQLSVVVRHCPPQLYVPLLLQLTSTPFSFLSTLPPVLYPLTRWAESEVEALFITIGVFAGDKEISCSTDSLSEQRTWWTSVRHLDT